MGIKLLIDSSEISKITEDLAGIKARAQDIEKASPGIRLILQEDVDFRFQTAPSTETGGEVYGGVQWEALSDSYLLANPLRRNGQILRDTGELQQSLTVQGHPYNIFGVSKDEIVFGTALSKASRLQKKRPFVFWHPKLIEKVAIFLANYLGTING